MLKKKEEMHTLKSEYNNINNMSYEDYCLRKRMVNSSGMDKEKEKEYDNLDCKKDGKGEERKREDENIHARMYDGVTVGASHSVKSGEGKENERSISDDKKYCNKMYNKENTIQNEKINAKRNSGNLFVKIVFWLLKFTYALLPLFAAIFVFYIPHIHKLVPDEWAAKHLIKKYILPAYDYDYYNSVPSSSSYFSSPSLEDFADIYAIAYEDSNSDEKIDDEAFRKNITMNVKNGLVPSPRSLTDHSKGFKKQILHVVDNVYVAIGYGLANSAIIIGKNNECIVIDTMESVSNMQNVWTDFKKHIKEKTNNKNELKVKGIIYTHFHTDHILGAAAIYKKNYTEIHAYYKTEGEINKVFTLVGGLTYIRSMRQFGVFVESKNFVNAGIGPKLYFDDRTAFGSVTPTHIMYQDRMNVTIAGVDLELIHAPGESSDQMVVWYKKKEVLMGADNIYKAFPNIYAIRGTESRDCSSWILSLDKMRALKPKYLVLGHTQPITGYTHIHDVLLIYRDAIQFVHDQTVRYLNKGYDANEIVEKVSLPVHMRKHPYLQEHYGKIAWSVRAIVTRYVGWFSGKPEDLNPLPSKQRALGLADLAGGLENLLAKAEDNFEKGNYQWALELSSAAYNIDKSSKKAKELRINSCRGLASLQKSAGGRNWYLSAALELEGKLTLKLSDRQKKDVLHKFNMRKIFEFVPARLNPEALSLRAVIAFHFEDTGEKACTHFRNGIAFTTWPCETKPDNEIYTKAAVWRSILNSEINPAMAFATGQLKVTGSLSILMQCFSAIELDV